MEKIIWILVLSLIMIPPVMAQVIKLRSGHTIKGKILEKTKKYIVVDEGLGQPTTYYMNVDKELITEDSTQNPPSQQTDNPQTGAPQESVPAPLPDINYD